LFVSGTNQLLSKIVQQIRATQPAAPPIHPCRIAAMLCLSTAGPDWPKPELNQRFIAIDLFHFVTGHARGKD
jgi:hypothetical protein